MAKDDYKSRTSDKEFQKGVSRGLKGDFFDDVVDELGHIIVPEEFRPYEVKAEDKGFHWGEAHRHESKGKDTSNLESRTRGGSSSESSYSESRGGYDGISFTRKNNLIVGLIGTILTIGFWGLIGYGVYSVVNLVPSMENQNKQLAEMRERRLHGQQQRKLSSLDNGCPICPDTKWDPYYNPKKGLEEQGLLWQLYHR